MKKLLSTLVCLIASIGVWAYEFEVDGICYGRNWNDYSGVYVTYYSSDNATHYTGNIVIPESVTYNGVEYKVIRIGHNAFYNCTGLTSIILPNSITSIDSYAFWNCKSLASVTLPNSLETIESYSFVNCSALESINIPEGVISIRENAFSLCSKLLEVNLPSTLETIGNATFQGCTSLASITIPENVKTIGGFAFMGCSNLESFGDTRKCPWLRPNQTMS